MLLDGGVYTQLFWLVQIGLGSLLPLALIYAPQTQNCRLSLIAACLLALLGGMAQIYVILVGGQAFPLEMFPGMEVSSSFFDGVVGQYTPSIWEILLGFGGVALSLLIVTVGVAILHFLPDSLADNVTQIK